MKSKILLFVKTPPPVTGATMMNSYVAESKLLHETFLINTIHISYKKQIKNTSIFSVKKVYVYFLTFFRLVKYILLFHPKLIYFQLSHLGVSFYRDCTYIFIIKLLRKHIVYHLHGKGIKQAVLNSTIRRLIYKWVFKNSSVICLSESLTADLSGIFDKKIFIVNNAIPMLSSNESRLFTGVDLVQMLFLSNLIISKGIFVFLDSIFLVNQKCNGKLSAWIVGEEAEVSGERLNYEIEKRGISDVVRYLGPKYNEEKNEILRNTDVLIYPSYNDVWGLVILEAMQAGLPVIATDEGAIPEIVDDGITGFIVKKNNPYEIAEKMEYLINKQDVRMNMGKAGRKKYLENYTLEIFESNIKCVFDEILKNM